MSHWGKPDMDFKKAIESVLVEGIGSRRDRKKRTFPAGVGEGPATLPMTGSRRRASVEDASVAEMADAITTLLEREFGPDLDAERRSPQS